MEAPSTVLATANCFPPSLLHDMQALGIKQWKYQDTKQNMLNVPKTLWKQTQVVSLKGPSKEDVIIFEMEDASRSAGEIETEEKKIGTFFASSRLISSLVNTNVTTKAKISDLIPTNTKGMCFNPGEIYWGYFPFSNGEGAKRRPILILAKNGILVVGVELSGNPDSVKNLDYMSEIKPADCVRYLLPAQRQLVLLANFCSFFTTDSNILQSKCVAELKNTKFLELCTSFNALYKVTI